MRWILFILLLVGTIMAADPPPPFTTWPRDYGVQRSNHAIRVDIDTLLDTLSITGIQLDTLRQIQFTILNPHLMVDTTTVVWTNASQDTAILLGLRAWTNTSAFNFDLYEYNAALTVRSLLIDPEIDYYTSGEITTFDETKIAPGNVMVYHRDVADTANYIKVTMRLTYLGITSMPGGSAGGGDSVLTWGDTLNHIATDAKIARRVLHFTLTNPQDMPGDSCIVWSNETGYSVTVQGLAAWSTTDDYSFALKEYTNSGAAAGGTVKDTTISENGSGNLYYLPEITAFDHATIEDMNCLWLVTSEDSTAWLKCAIRYFVNYP